MRRRHCGMSASRLPRSSRRRSARDVAKEPTSVPTVRATSAVASERSQPDLRRGRGRGRAGSAPPRMGSVSGSSASFSFIMRRRKKARRLKSSNAASANLDLSSRADSVAQRGHARIRRASTARGRSTRIVTTNVAPARPRGSVEAQRSAGLRTGPCRRVPQPPPLRPRWLKAMPRPRPAAVCSAARRCG